MALVTHRSEGIGVSCVAEMNASSRGFVWSMALRILFCINSLDPIGCVLHSENGELVNTLKTTAVWFQCA